jgi:hypothetical protein
MISVDNPKGVEINGIRLGVVSGLVDAYRNGDELTADATPTEQLIALRVYGHYKRMTTNGYTREHILASMQRKMIDMAQRFVPGRV